MKLIKEKKRGWIKVIKLGGSLSEQVIMIWDMILLWCIMDAFIIHSYHTHNYKRQPLPNFKDNIYKRLKVWNIIFLFQVHGIQTLSLNFHSSHRSRYLIVGACCHTLVMRVSVCSHTAQGDRWICVRFGLANGWWVGPKEA